MHRNGASNVVIRSAGLRVLPRSSTERNTHDGTSQDDQVQPNRPVTHVIRIHLHPLGIACVAPPTDLPDAGHTWPYALVQSIYFPVFWHLGIHDGAGTREAHLRAQDVPQLGQLIHAGLAQETTDAGNAGVVT